MLSKDIPPFILLKIFPLLSIIEDVDYMYDNKEPINFPTDKKKLWGALFGRFSIYFKTFISPAWQLSGEV